MTIVKENRGFTLIELLVVIAIIGILTAVVIASLNTARVKAQDSQRLSDLKQIQTALEMYYNDYGYYPKRMTHTETDSGCGGHVSWCGDTNSLKYDLSPYLNLPNKTSSGFDKLFYYESNSNDNNQTYGLMVDLKSESNINKETNDGGYLNHMYEIGQQPAYCMSKYSGTDAYWWSYGATTVCKSGN